MFLINVTRFQPEKLFFSQLFILFFFFFFRNMDCGRRKIGVTRRILVQVKASPQVCGAHRILFLLFKNLCILKCLESHDVLLFESKHFSSTVSLFQLHYHLDKNTFELHSPFCSFFSVKVLTSFIICPV